MKLSRSFLDCLTVLSGRDRKKYWVVVTAQGVLGFLDLIGVAAMGVIGALAIRGVQSQPVSGSVNKVLKVFQLEGFTFQSQVAILGIFAAAVLIIRTVLGMYLTWRVLNFLSARSAVISSQLLAKITNSGYLQLTKYNAAELQFILGPGVSSLAVGVLGTASTAFSDISTLVIVATGIVFIDPVIALVSIGLFSSIGLYLYFILHKFSENLGRNLTTENVVSNSLISEIIRGYRELFVRNRLPYYRQQVIQSKYLISEMQAKNSFLPSISKYVIEIAVVLGAALVSAAQFILNDATHAFASLGIFLAAGTRIAPALLRLQQGAIGIKSNIGMSYLTLNALKDFSNVEKDEDKPANKSTTVDTFTPKITIQNLKFKYESEDSDVVDIPRLEIQPGTTVALVGPSGAGKTTLVDLMLGILKPTTGQILISGVAPIKAIGFWPGALAYVPQIPMMKQGSVIQNVALGFHDSEVCIDEVIDSLKKAQLWDFVNTLPLKIESKVGENGVGLSGGQLQRLGIARALYLNPKLIVLDEATSALDGITEKEISDAISTLKSEATLVIIAHRLSTVLNADLVYYMRDGKIVSSGTFEEVRRCVPEFDQQAKLIGL